MSAIEHYINVVEKGLHADTADREQILIELRQHIEESRAEFMGQGLPPAEAERLAISRLGPPQDMCRNFDALYRNSPLRFVLNHFCREKTMTTITVLRTLSVASTVLICLIAFPIILLLSGNTIPQLTRQSHWIAENLPSFEIPAWISLFALASKIMFGWYGILTFLLIGIVVMIWIRKLSGETTAQFLRTVLSGMSLLLVVVLVWGLSAASQLGSLESDAQPMAVGRWLRFHPQPQVAPHAPAPGPTTAPAPAK